VTQLPALVVAASAPSVVFVASAPKIVITPKGA
jgi:hypothetical protein